MKNTVRLRPVEDRDIEFLYTRNNQNFMGAWQGFRYISLSSYKRRFSDGGFNNDKMQVLVIENCKRRVGFMVADFPSQHVVNIGISLDEDARGCGVCKMALSQVVGYFFENYLIERIEADTDADNKPALAVLEAAGFVREGTLRHRRFHHGVFHDSVYFSLLREDWHDKNACVDGNWRAKVVKVVKGGR